MTVSPVSGAHLVQAYTPVQGQTHTNKQQASSGQPEDSVQLSPAAMAHLKGADSDGDGDGH
jgi:hypothetical protein